MNIENPNSQKSELPNQKLETNIISNEIKRPGNAMPEDTLWQPRIETGEDGRKTEKGVLAPDGTYYELQEGEKFVINREENGDYEAVVVGLDGKERFLRKSLVREKAESEQRDKEKLAEARKGLRPEQSEVNLDNKQADLLKKLDRNLLKKMTEETMGVQEVRYGKEFNLDNDKREQLKIIAQIVKNFLESKKQDSRWTKLQELMKERQKKGFSGGFIFPPSWLIDGGTDATVQKIKLADGGAGIQVPSEIYNLYYWDRTVDDLNETVVEQSDNALKDRSAKHLNKTLVELSSFFKESGLIK